MSNRIVACLKCGDEFTALGSRGPARRFCPACKSEHRYVINATRRTRYQHDPDYAARRRASAHFTAREKIKIRTAAREEARERGVPIEKILREWRV